ncbi:tegument protein UL7 [Common bottlenose dolphin gammaherpesvirus 1 strain Sarasota]|uniref:Tegument protein UL7 n=1 Tax=Common bottlenose dolphin gammaherpesvirus 1 strain Sarasota TaxID=2022783 RepID=A0A1Z1NEI2_9GAMA|nr:tegument protein UL7 [Common bottlenose dolphin gammaherpesvirus 1 strain Sarasota]ARW78104.1 tegument protein UL7 [Common bottlenose dolphin gammaherpesvirus 1 strain Sarasota]
MSSRNGSACRRFFGRKRAREPAETGPRFLKPPAQVMCVRDTKLPLIPRLVLEVKKTSKVCTAAHTPNFLTDHGDLKVKELVAHVKACSSSSHFVGFTLVSLVEPEDKVNTLDLYPHVLSERLLLFKPKKVSLLEMCALLSMAENLDHVTPVAARAILGRARMLQTLTNSREAAFLLRGIESVVGTAARLGAAGGADLDGLPDALVMFKLHHELERDDHEARGVLKAIYLESCKMGCSETPEKGKARKKDQISFNVIYSNTIFTRHLQNKDVISILRHNCLCDEPVEHIFPSQ